MSTKRIRKFKAERAALNATLLKYAPRSLKRFFSVDAEAFQPGALPGPTKELLGLVASLVLRCDDCILFHLNNCFQARVSDAEFAEAAAIAAVIGGTITIPHLRRAFQAWDELRRTRARRRVIKHKGHKAHEESVQSAKSAD